MSLWKVLKVFSEPLFTPRVYLKPSTYRLPYSTEILSGDLKLSYLFFKQPRRMGFLIRDSSIFRMGAFWDTYSRSLNMIEKIIYIVTDASSLELSSKTPGKVIIRTMRDLKVVWDVWINKVGWITYAAEIVLHSTAADVYCGRSLKQRAARSARKATCKGHHVSLEQT